MTVETNKSLNSNNHSAPKAIVRWDHDNSYMYLDSKPVKYLTSTYGGKLEFASDLNTTRFRNLGHVFKGILLATGGECLELIRDFTILGLPTKDLLLVDLNTGESIKGWSGVSLLSQITRINIDGDLSGLHLLKGYYVSSINYKRLIKREHNFSAKRHQSLRGGFRDLSKGRFVDSLMAKYTLNTLRLGHWCNDLVSLEVPPTTNKISGIGSSDLKVVISENKLTQGLKISDDYTPSDNENYIEGEVLGTGFNLIKLIKYLDVTNSCGGKEHYVIYIPSNKWLIKSWHLPSCYRFQLTDFFSAQNSILTPEYLTGALLIKVTNINVEVD